VKPLILDLPVLVAVQGTIGRPLDITLIDQPFDRPSNCYALSFGDVLAPFKLVDSSGDPDDIAAILKSLQPYHDSSLDCSVAAHLNASFGLVGFQ
jgi:hypothetical protein